MRAKLFYHSLISDWNHGNAHFLRGIVSELQARGHEVEVFEPANGWSYENLVAEHGEAPVRAFRERFPEFRSTFYDPETLDLDNALQGADLALVHEWNDHDLVRRIGEHHARRGGYVLFFHDTHHRSITDPDSMARYDLSSYDGVLAYGKVLRRIYLDRRWARRVWTWHEAADVRVFRPMPQAEKDTDVVWIGNWGDEERTAELYEYVIDPIRELGLKARVYGVRYPKKAIEALRSAGIEYGGWLPNWQVPMAFGRASVTVHVPRRPYATALPGIPTIRPFEALACGIPLISAPWNDCEGLFEAGKDFLTARNGAEMRQHLRALLDNAALAQEMAEHGRRTVLSRHTCAHRVDQLLSIFEEVASSREVQFANV
jgi:spore maturation protein CgeB